MTLQSQVGNLCNFINPFNQLWPAESYPFFKHHFMLFDSLQLSGVLLGNVYCVSQLAVAWRRNSFRSRWAVPRMVDNWTLPRRSGTFCLTNQVFAPFDMLKRAPITIDIIMTFEAPWTLLISNASSWYFSTFSSPVLMMYWSAGTAMSISVHFFAFMH